MNEVEVKISKINGKGVFALKNFKLGEVVIDWSSCSEVISREKFLKMSGRDKKYVSFVEEEFIIFREPAKFVNHSCNPNTKVRGKANIAVRDIEEGEEITTDYTLETDHTLENASVEFKCRCRSKNCEGKKV